MATDSPRDLRELDPLKLWNERVKAHNRGNADHVGDVDAELKRRWHDELQSSLPLTPLERLVPPLGGTVTAADPGELDRQRQLEQPVLAGLALLRKAIGGLERFERARRVMLDELGDTDPRAQRGNAYRLGFAEGELAAQADALEALGFSGVAGHLRSYLVAEPEPAGERP